MIFEFTVRGDRIEANKDYSLIEGNKGSYEAVFDFDEEWEELAKVCIVRSGGKKFKIAITGGSCLLPVLYKGSAKIGVVGVVSLDGAELTTRISTNWKEIGIQSGAYDEETAEEFSTVAEVWEQYLSEIENHRKAAEIAQQGAKNAETTAGESAEQAQGYMTDAKTSADSAAISEKEAEEHKNTSVKAAEIARTSAANAEAARKASEEAKENLETAESNAKTSAETAEQSASDAEGFADNAKASADNAAKSEENAKASEEAAAKSKADTAELTSRAETAAENAEESEVKSAASEKSAQQALSDLLAMINSGDIVLATDGKLPLSAIPATATQEIYTVTSEDELTSLTAQRGDLAELIEEVDGERTITKTWQCLEDASVRDNWVVWGTSYAVQAGNATTADNASNANMINNHRVVEMTEEEFQAAVKDEDTYYLVY